MNKNKLLNKLYDDEIVKIIIKFDIFECNKKLFKSLITKEKLLKKISYNN